MAPTSATSTRVGQTAPPVARSTAQAGSSAVHRPAQVLASCAVGVAVLVADAASGEARLALLGVAAMLLALAMTLTQAVSAPVGRPRRTSRLAARAATAASLFVAAFLSSVGVLERMGPEVTDSAAFAAGVAVMSVVLLVVLPSALLVFGWTVLRDRGLRSWLRVLPCVLLLVVAFTVIALALTDGSQELWLQAAAVAAAGATLTGFSAGVSRLPDRR